MSNANTKKEMKWGKALMLFFIAASCIWHLNFRNRHFQEIDSECILPDYITENFYPSPSSKTHRLKKFWTNSFERGGTPTSLKGMAGVGLGTTYSPLVGFIYGLLYSDKDSFESFNSKALFVTIGVFHMSLWLLFLVVLRVKVNIFIALLCIVLYSFSYTNYNYAYHLGNYGWNTFFFIFWIYLFPLYYKNVFLFSSITGVLCWGSYFMVPLLVSYILYSFIVNKKNNESIYKFVKSHALSVFLLLLLTLSFYPPNQGSRLYDSPISEVPILFYYFILNAFAQVSHEGMVKWLQFTLPLCLLLYGFFLYFKNKMLAFKHNALFFTTLFYLGFLFFAIIFKRLNFMPSRHFIFLYPLLYIVMAIALNKIVANKYIGKLLCVVVFSVGCMNLLNQRKSLVKLYSPTNDFRNQLTFKDKKDFTYFSYRSYDIEKIFTNNTIKDSSYHLIGTNFTMDRLVEIGQFDSARLSQYIVTTDSSKITNRYFIAYNPYRYSFNQPNNVYYQTIKKK
jgi:hypothetical protein